MSPQPLIGLIPLLAFVVLVNLALVGLYWRYQRRRKERRGFPILPPRRNDTGRVEGPP